MRWPSRRRRRVNRDVDDAVARDLDIDIVDEIGPLLGESVGGIVMAEWVIQRGQCIVADGVQGW